MMSTGYIEKNNGVEVPADAIRIIDPQVVKNLSTIASISALANLC